MKHIKLYEKFIDDANKIVDNIYHYSDKLELSKKEKLEKIDLYLSEITSAFKNLSEKNNKKKILPLNYKVDEFTEFVNLYSYDDNVIKIETKTEILFLDDTSIQYLAYILDTLYEKYPDYFEGKDMGFFDLKTK